MKTDEVIDTKAYNEIMYIVKDVTNIVDLEWQLKGNILGVGSIWIHRAKEEFDTQFGKMLLKRFGITGEYEGIGHCALGYAAEPAKEAAPRKENYVYYAE